MNKIITAAAIALLPALCSCIPAAEPPQPSPMPADGDAYVARGNEPGWMLTMDEKTIAYQGDYGQTKISVPAVTGTPSFNGMRYITPRLTVDVTYAACSDDMSGKRFADSVMVTADGRTVKGCGGRALPPETLDDTHWKIVSIDEMPVASGGKAAELHFAGGKISGSAGCNNLSGGYLAEGTSLTFAPIAATRMMCPEPQMTQEMKLLGILKGKAATRYTIDGKLIVTGENGSRLMLEQIN